jgi:putative ABC transport system permease protein
MFKDYLHLAYSSVKQRKVRSWLTMIGIFIGIAAVVALVSLSQGLQEAIAQQFVNLGSDKLIVQAAGSSFGPPGTAVSNPLTFKEEDTIEKINGVELALGRLLRTVKIEFEDEIKYTYAVSLPDDSRKIQLAIESNNYKIQGGRLLEKGDLYNIMVGNDFAENFFDVPLQVRDKVLIQDQQFEIVGIMKKSGNPQQDSTLVIPDSALREILSTDEEYDMIAVKVSAGENIDLVAEGINKELRKLRNVEEGDEDFSVQTPGQLLSILSNILLIVQGVLVGIAAISLVVGGIGIMNTMYTAVTERTKEIGVMKATGAKNSQILLLFLTESGLLGLTGGVIGVSLGMAISKSVELIAFQIYESYLIQASFSPWLIFGSLLFAFLVGAASGAFPARQASQLKPVDALRK